MIWDDNRLTGSGAGSAKAPVMVVSLQFQDDLFGMPSFQTVNISLVTTQCSLSHMATLDWPDNWV